MNLFDLSLQLNGFPIKKAQQILKGIHAQSDNEFTRYIEKKKKEIVAYHIQNNSFYSNFVKNVNQTDWKSLPIMTKRDLQKPFLF